MKLHRRTFTKLSLLSGAGALVLPGCESDNATPAEAAHLSPGERVLFERFAEVYIPTDGTNLRPLSEVPYLDNIDRVLGHLDAPTLNEVHTGMKLFDYGSILIGFHLSRFANLNPEERAEYINTWESGGETQRAVVGLIKKLVAFGYWQDVEAARRVGYQGPVSDEAKILSLGNAPMPVIAPDPGTADTPT
ncbi:MAG: hypothetical protein WBG86_13620 [Polyangiales bacterium]